MFSKYRNLLGELTRKNVKLKYRDSWLGIFWSFLQPLLNMIVLSVVFGNIFGANRKHIICYPVYLLQADFCLNSLLRQQNERLPRLEAMLLL